MKKILFVTTRFPLPILGGDKIRAIGILKFLSKKNKVDLVCISNKNHKKTHHPKIWNNVKIFKIKFFKRLIHIFVSIIKNEPMQVGFYHCDEMKEYINEVQERYDSIIFHTLRTSQYLPDNFKGKKILEMTDLSSVRYQQTFQHLSFLNPLKYIYLLEKNLVEKYEKKIINLFDKSILVSKEDVKKATIKLPKKKLLFIRNGCYVNKKLFKFNKKNYKILFLGNIKYPPNKYACYEFAKEVLPEINKIYPEIRFHIVGKINFFDRYSLKRFKNVEIFGPIKNISNVIKNNICGICNLKIATGFQNKIVNYMSYGIPTIASFNSYEGLGIKKNKEILVYNSNQELIKYIKMAKKNKKKAESLSSYSHKAIKNRYDWDKTLFNYAKIV